MTESFHLVVVSFRQTVQQIDFLSLVTVPRHHLIVFYTSEARRTILGDIDSIRGSKQLQTALPRKLNRHK